MIFAPPPPAKRQKIEHEPQQLNENVVEGDYPDSFQFPYSKYLELVVKILESHPVFQEKLKGLSETDIKEGKIADHMDDLPQDLFDKLTEAKVEEIERIRADLEKQIEKDGDARNVVMPEHLDVSELKKFGKEDLRKLIKK
uniref:NUCB1-like N-terminal domain-containing protein n=1 Tax=Meloidogyne javanica TaxID=6303 RepID=A0A915MC32_MELJA